MPRKRRPPPPERVRQHPGAASRGGKVGEPAGARKAEPSPAGGEAARRRRTVHDFRRAVIVEAARRVLAEKGPEGASVRAIARAAGYTPAALYYYYPDKEHVLAEVLAHALAGLRHSLRQAVAASPTSEARLRGVLTAFFDYHRAHADLFDLGLRADRTGRELSPALERRLAGRLIAALAVIAETLAEFGRLEPAAANREAVAAVCHISGVLALDRSGRLATLGFEAEALLAHYLDGLIERLHAG